MRSNIFSGFLFDKHWENAMRQLKPKQFYQLFWEFYDYHMSAGSTPIPSHSDNQKLDTIVSLIQPQIKKRLCCARVFVKEEELPSPVLSDTQSVAHSVALCAAQGATVCAAPIVRESKGEERIVMECMGVEGSGSSVAVPPQAVPTAQATMLQNSPPPPQKKGLENSENKKAYGEKKNVMLTEEEYAYLTQKLGISLAYIDRFSEKLASNPYRYADHAEALKEWWEQDKEKPKWSPSRGKLDIYEPQNYPSSFDTEDFYNAAVRRSMEIMQRMTTASEKEESPECVTEEVIVP